MNAPRRLGGIVIPEQGIPPAPPAGSLSLYAKGDRRPYVQDSLGQEIPLIPEEAIYGNVPVALARWRTAFAVARAGAGMATISMYGDSIIEGFFSRSLYERASDILGNWIGRSISHSSGKLAGFGKYFPLVSGNGTGANWPGPPSAGQDPWTYTGTVTPYDGIGGPSQTLVVLGPGAKVSGYLPGESFVLSYTRASTVPNASSLRLRLDGVVTGTWNTYSSTTTYGVFTAHNAAQPSEYGYHLVEIENTHSTGSIIVEGIYAFGGIADNGSIAVYNYGNGGSFAATWADSAAGMWENVALANNPDVIIWNLGTNDATVGKTPAQYEAEMKTIVGKLTNKLTPWLSPGAGFIFLLWPSANMTPRSEWWQALKRVADYVPGKRGIAIDMMPFAGDIPPNANTITRARILEDGVHLTAGAGQHWFAEILYKLLEPSPPPPPLPISGPLDMLDIQMGSTVFPVSGTSTGATVPVTFDRPFAEGPWIAGAVSTNTGALGNLGVFAANGPTATGFTARLIKVHTDLTFSSDIGVRWIAVGRSASW